MAVQRTLIGNIKGPKGDKGDTGDTGARGAAATVTIGSVTTTAYGGNANVTNSGTSTDAVFDFVLPQGAPGETVTDMENLTLSSMTEPSVQFPTPSIGDTGKVLFGKVTKWFSDMRALSNTKLDIANLVNGFTQTVAGTHALDAAAGKLLNDKIQWTEPQSLTGLGSSITLPSSWTEANVRLGLGGARYFVFHLVRNNFYFGQSTAYNIRNGYYATNGNNAYVSINLVTHTDRTADIQLVDAFLTGTDLANTTTIQVTYKHT